MPCYEAKMSSKGQVTLPVEVRRFFKLQEGDLVDFFIDPKTELLRVVARNGNLADLQGLLKTGPRETLSQAEIDAAIGDHLAEEDERIKASWNEMHEFQEWRKAKAVRAAE